MTVLPSRERDGETRHRLPPLYTLAPAKAHQSPSEPRMNSRSETGLFRSTFAGSTPLRIQNSDVPRRTICHDNEIWTTCLCRKWEMLRRSRARGRSHRSSRRRCRQGGRPSWGTRGRRARPRRNRKEKTLLNGTARFCITTLKGQKRPVDCGDRRHRFRHRGLPRARAASRERIDGTGLWGRGRGASRRKNHARRPSAAGWVRDEKKCPVSLRTIIGIFTEGDGGLSPRAAYDRRESRGRRHSNIALSADGSGFEGLSRVLKNVPQNI